jgi:hypothetical protein
MGPDEVVGDGLGKSEGIFLEAGGNGTLAL